MNPNGYEIDSDIERDSEIHIQQVKTKFLKSNNE